MHVVIKGASSGIGAALAREFARAGASLTLVARRTALLESLAADLGVPVHIVAADLSDLDRCTSWLDGATAALGPIDVLVNNAGVHVAGPLEETDLSRADQLIRLNLQAPMRISSAVLPDMLARGTGIVVDVASAAATAPLPGCAYYNASKAGLAAASESLRGELRGTGVHVVTVYPGIIADTDMAKSVIGQYQATRATSLTPVGSSEELARRVRHAVERRRDRVIYPRSMAATRYLPNTTRWVLDRYTPSLRKSRTGDAPIGPGAPAAS